MADVEIMGTKVGMPPPKTLVLILAGGAAIGLLLLSRKPAPIPGAPTVDASGMAEFQQVVAEAAPELARINASQRIDERQFELQLQLARLMAPTASRTCLTWGTWNAMSTKERDRYNKQVRQGKALLQPSVNGPCFQPTGAGLGGHQPYVTSESRQGFFSSSKRIRGPGGSFQPQDWQPGAPQVGSVLSELLPYLFSYGIIGPGDPRVLGVM